MKKLSAIFLIVCLIPISGFAAYDWPASGFKVIKQSINTELKKIELSDPSGYRINIKYYFKADEKYFPRVIELNSILRSWKDIQIQSLNFYIQNDVINIAAPLISYQYKSINYSPYLLSGLYFTDDGELKYNFRLVKDNLFVRIRGFYQDEAEMGKKVEAAAIDPLKYIEKFDPLYLYQQTENLNNQVIFLKKQIISLIYTALKVELTQEAILAKQTVNKDSFLKSGLRKGNIKIVVDILSETPDMNANGLNEALKSKGVSIDPKILARIMEFVG